MKVGIVGLPNAGKSSLFTALTGVAAQTANYPFTTIEPNVAIVPVADERLDQVATTIGASKAVPDTVAFHDIAGLVAGAHKGEGLGNQFLANIRETDAIVHVVRAHQDPGVVHPEGRVDPLKDIETIETELLYADLEQAERRSERVSKTAKSGDRHAVAEAQWLERLIGALQAGRPARTVPPPADAPDALELLQPLTAKPVLFVANVDEGAHEVPAAIAQHARAHGAQAVAISARLEAELAELEEADAAAMRADLGLSESGLEAVVRGAFALLELIAFFTAGEDKPAQSWHLRRGQSAWQAAGLIHTDIQRGFVRAEVIRVGPAGRRRGLRRRPGAGHAAARGARLRDRRRRRDHGQVHALTAGAARPGGRMYRQVTVVLRVLRSGIRRLGGWLPATAAVVVLAGCSATVTGTTNIKASSATLNATASCDTGQTCTWYWEYWVDGTDRNTSEQKTPVYGPVSGQTGPVNLSTTITGLAYLQYL